MYKKKWITLISTAAILLGTTAAFIPLPFQTNTPVSHQSTVKAATLNRKKAKRKLIKWLKKHDQYNPTYSLTYDSFDGNSYLFHYYEDMGDHTATVNWYYVDRDSGKVTAMF